MPKRGKRYQQAKSEIDVNRVYHPLTAVRMIKGQELTRFDPTVEVHMRLGVNVRHADQQLRGTITPVEVTVYEDRSFTFITKVPPAAVLIRQALNIPKGSPEPHKEKVANLTRAQLRQIAETKMPDLNANTVESAMEIIAGTARSMGVTVDAA